MERYDVGVKFIVDRQTNPPLLQKQLTLPDSIPHLNLEQNLLLQTAKSHNF